MRPAECNQHICLYRAEDKPYLVSALVSTYNAQEFIRGRLEDLESQTLAEQLEIIVIDSGSPQDEKKIVHDMRKTFSNITYIRTDTRESVYSAWNRGLQVARGTYITNANTDDRLKNDALEILARHLEEHPEIDVVYAKQHITDAPNQHFHTARIVGTHEWPHFSRNTLFEYCCVGPQPLWRKSLHDQFGFFDERLEVAGDYEFWLRISDRCRFALIDEYLGLYYKSPEGANKEFENRYTTFRETADVRKKYFISTFANKNRQDLSSETQTTIDAIAQELTSDHPLGNSRAHLRSLEHLHWKASVFFEQLGDADASRSIAGLFFKIKNNSYRLAFQLRQISPATCPHPQQHAAPTVSLIVASREPSDALYGTLESISRQTFHNIELIIAIGNHPALHSKLCDSIFSVSWKKMIRILPCGTGTHAEICARAVPYAHGKLLVCMQPGGECAPDFTEKAVAAFIHNPETDIVVTDTVWYGSENRISPLDASNVVWNRSTVHGCMIKKAAWAQVAASLHSTPDCGELGHFDAAHLKCRHLPLPLFFVRCAGSIRASEASQPLKRSALPRSATCGAHTMTTDTGQPDTPTHAPPMHQVTSAQRPRAHTTPAPALDPDVLSRRGAAALQRNDLQSAIAAFDEILERIDPLHYPTVVQMRKLEKKLGAQWLAVREKYFLSRCKKAPHKATYLQAAQFYNSPAVMRFLHEKLQQAQSAQRPQATGPPASVIIACYNGARDIAKTVQSVLRQTWRNREIIIVDDGSTDASWAVIAGLQKSAAERITCHRIEKNAGVAHARNLGASLAAGDYLAFLDTGDELLPCFLETMIQSAATHPGQGWLYPVTLQLGSINRLWSYRDFTVSDNLSRNMQPVTSLIPKELFMNVGGFPAELRNGYEDWYFWLKAIRAGFTGRLVKDILFVYHRKDDSRNTCLQQRRDLEYDAKMRIIQAHQELYVPIGEPEKEKLRTKLRIDASLIHPRHTEFIQHRTSVPAAGAAAYTVQFYVYKNVHWPMFEALYTYLRNRPEVQEIIICLPDLSQLIASQNYSLVEKILSLKTTVVTDPRSRTVDVTFIADTIAGKVSGCGKIVNIGHGTISKGYYFTESFWTDRENWVDLLCVPGPFAAKRFAHLLTTRVAATGMPKLDPVFSGAYDKRHLCRLLGLDEHKKIVLYAPTFNVDLSSAYAFEERFHELRRPDIYLLIKLHGSTMPHTVEAYRRLAKRFDDIIYVDDPNIAPYLGGADIMLSDVSSAFMEFMALDRPVLLYNNPDRANYHGYNENDIEYAWRGLGTQTSSFDDLKDKLQTIVVAGDDGRSAIRLRYAAELFADRDGRACENVWRETVAMLAEAPSKTVPVFSAIIALTDDNLFAVRTTLHALQFYSVMPIQLVFVTKSADSACADFIEMQKTYGQFLDTTVIEASEQASADEMRLAGMRAALGDFILWLDDSVNVYKNFDYIVHQCFVRHPEMSALTGVTISNEPRINALARISPPSKMNIQRYAYEFINKYQGKEAEDLQLTHMPSLVVFKNNLLAEADLHSVETFKAALLPHIGLCPSLFYTFLPDVEMEALRNFWATRSRIPLPERIRTAQVIRQHCVYPDIAEQLFFDLRDSNQPKNEQFKVLGESLLMRFYDVPYKQKIIRVCGEKSPLGAALAREITLIGQVSGGPCSEHAAAPASPVRHAARPVRVLFYFFKNVHIPVLIPIYTKFKELYPDVETAFGYLEHAPRIRAGFTPEELQVLTACGEKMYGAPQDFQPDLTFIADSVYPWVQGCGKLVHVGHGVLSKGQYYTNTDTARREEQADVVCVPGAYHRQIMQKIISKPVIATGMAKLDGLFSGAMNRDAAIRTYGLPRNTYRYILFAPTFNDELSAVPFVGDRIGEIAPDDKTLVIVKLHGSARKEYKDMYQGLVSRDQRVIYADEHDISPLLALADVMISDVSSAMMEFAALDKPVVLFNNPHWSSYQHYNPDDIEFKWRDIGMQTRDLSEMKQAVAECLARPAAFAEARRKYTDLLFANKYDGRAAERIAQTACNMFFGAEPDSCTTVQHRN